MNLKENEILECPRCGATRFRATAHVTQDWVIDEKGNFATCTDDCMEVTHFPDLYDIIDCDECGFSDDGRVFVTAKQEGVPSETSDEDFPNPVEKEKYMLGEVVFDITTCVPLFTAKGALAENFEYDSRDLYASIFEWAKEFEQKYPQPGFDYMNLVEEFARKKLHDFFELEE